MSVKVDNFDRIRPMLEFDDAHYYHIELIVRKKDFPEGLCQDDHKVAGSYYVSSMAHFNAIEEEIKTLCRMYNARAYINLNRKSLKQTSIILMHELLKMMENDEYRRLFSKLNSAAGLCKGDKDTRTFLVDVDTADDAAFLDVLDAVIECGGEQVAVLPTPSGGTHVITTPFDVAEFGDITARLKDVVEIKHNCPTVLYYGGQA